MCTPTMSEYKIYKNPFSYEDFYKEEFLKQKIMEVSSKWRESDYIKGCLDNEYLKIDISHIDRLIGLSGSEVQEDSTTGQWTLSIVDAFCAYLWASSYYALVAFDYKSLSDANYTMDSCSPLPSFDMLYGAACLKKFANEAILSGKAKGQWACYPDTIALLPNPFIFEANREFYIVKVNGIYAFALAFVLCHEYKHYFHLEHKSDCDDAENKRKEFDADYTALSAYKEMDNAEKKTYAAGIATVMYVISKMDSVADAEGEETDNGHPPAFERLEKSLEGLELDSNDILYEYAGFLFENEKKNDFLHPVKSVALFQNKHEYFKAMLHMDSQILYNKQMRNFCCQMFQMDGEKPESIGTGSLIKIFNEEDHDYVYLLFTAAHVAKESNLAIETDSSRSTEPFYNVLENYSLISSDEKKDWAMYRLEEKTIDHLLKSGHSFFEYKGCKSEGLTAVFCGFPATKNKTKRSEVRCRPYSYQGNIVNAELYDALAINSKEFIMVNFEPEKVIDCDTGEKITFPDPHGMSGGPIFDNDFNLIGLVLYHEPKLKVLYGIRLSAVMDEIGTMLKSQSEC